VLVVVSSLAAAGPAPSDRLRTETDPPVQVSHYGRSKRAGEKVAEKFADRLPVTVVRPAIVFGEGDPKMLAMFRPIVRFGLHIVPGRGRRKYSLIHAADLATLLILAAQRGQRLDPVAHAGASTAKGYYFAAGPDHLTYAELGRAIATAVGRDYVRVLPTPPRTLWVVASVNQALSQVLRRPFTFDLDKAREAAAGSWVCSVQRAVDELGFRTAAPLAVRLCQTARWYRENGWL
jgi:nucleoside-diphosphate-sugar epimerase